MLCSVEKVWIEIREKLSLVKSLVTIDLANNRGHVELRFFN